MITIQRGPMKAEIDPLGAELVALYKDGENKLWCRDPEIWGSSAPLLFPICGRLREGRYTHGGATYELSPHGFAKTALFTVAEQSEDRAVFELESSDETVKVYPFTFLLRAVYQLTDEGLEFRFEVENKGENVMYYSLGGHWGFALAEQLTAYTLAFDQAITLDREILDGAFLSGETERVMTEQKALPLSYRICDNDTYVFKNVPAACTLRHGTTPVVRLEYPDTPHLLLWTLPGQKYLCIEPWNGMPDGKESGELSQKDSICALEPGKQKTFTHKIILY